jgi:ubiquinone/menaquinone biosynthesis C-methylase UbiE
MELDNIVALIKNGVEQNYQRQVWADLGAGTGAFTHALSTLLNGKSMIYAVDKDMRSMDQISIDADVELVKLNQDFTEKLYFDEGLNGIVLANALHFIQNKTSLIKSLQSNLLPDGRIIIVEYGITHGNQWVPFPVNFTSLNALAVEAGFKNVVKLVELPSQYHRSMYSAMLS